MFELVSSLVFILAGLVTIIKYSQSKRTWSEAVCIFTNFIKQAAEVISDEMKKPKPAPVVNYPVWIGIEYGIVNPSIIERYFSDLERFYEIISFDKADYLNDKKNVLFYCFSCVKEKFPIEGKELVDLMCRVSEVTLTKYLRDYGFTLPVPPSQVIAVRLVHGKLAVYIACTNYGLAEIKQIKNEVRNSCSCSPPKSSPLEVHWGEGGKNP